MAKPVTIDFLANNRQLLRAVKEAEASLGGLDSQIARTNAAQATLGKSGNWPALNKAIRDATQQMAGYEAQIARGASASERLAASNERWARGAIAAAKVGAAGVAGLALALGGAATRAVQFDAAMRNVNSIAGLTQKQFKALEAQVIALAPVVGKSTTDLANGLYDIESSGFKGAGALKILKESAIAATAGITDTATSSAAIVAVLNAFHKPAEDAAKVSSVLFETVKQGVVSFPELAQQMGDLTGLAPTLGANIQSVTAAFALLTTQGGPAAERSTQVKAVLSALIKPSKDLSGALHSLGFESGAAGIKTDGLQGLLQKLYLQTHGNKEEIAKLFPNVRALAGFLGLTGDNAAKAAQFLGESNRAYRDGTEQTKAFNEQSKSTAAQLDKLKGGIDAAAVTIGTALLPELNKGIGALSAWLAQAQKSGELQHWAEEISKDVSATVDWLESLGPAAEKGLHVATATFHTAISVTQTLLHIVEAIAPELEAIGGAASGAAGALGTGPIVGAGIAYLGLNRALLTTQAGMGKYAKVMKAGAEATAIAGGGAVTAGGKIDAVGRAAVSASSTSKIAARGIASAFGPQLLVAGAAGIVLSLLYIKSTMSDLKAEAQDVVDAIAELQGKRIDLAAARIAQARAAAGLSVAQSTAGSRAVDLARLNAADPRPAALRNAAPTTAEIKATNDLAKANLNLRDAKLAVERADAVAAAAAGAKIDARNKLAQQLVGGAQQSLREARLADSNRRTAEVQTGRPVSAGEDAATERKAVDDLARSLHNAANASKTLDAAGKGAANRVADVVGSLAKIPTNKQFEIIAKDVAAGKSLAAIKRDLGIIDRTTAKPTVSVNKQPFDEGADEVGRRAAALDKLHPTISVSGSGFNAVQAGLDAIDSKILRISKPFTVDVTPAGGRKPGKTNISAGGMYVAGAYGADDTHVMVTGSEAILNPRQIGMVDSGRYSVLGALRATGAPTIQRGGGYAGGGVPDDVALQSKIQKLQASLLSESKHLDPLSKRLEGIDKGIDYWQGRTPDAKDKAGRKVKADNVRLLGNAEKQLRVVLQRKMTDERKQLSEAQTRYSVMTSQAPGAVAFNQKLHPLEAALAQAQQTGTSTTGPNAKLQTAYRTRIAYLQAESKKKHSKLVADQISQELTSDYSALQGYQTDATTASGGTAAYLTPEQQYQLDSALLLDANGNPIDPATAKSLLGAEIANMEAARAAAAGSGNFALASQIAQDENQVQSQLQSLSPATAGGGDTPAAPTPDADLLARNAQLTSQNLALTRGRGYGAAAQDAFDQGGLMFAVLGDGRSIGALATATAKGFNAQPYISSNAGTLTI